MKKNFKRFIYSTGNKYEASKIKLYLDWKKVKISLGELKAQIQMQSF